MLIATIATRVTRRQGVMVDVCPRPRWENQAHFAGQGIAVGTKCEPQPTANKGEAPDA
jgi:hypothetical protein